MIKAVIYLFLEVLYSTLRIGLHDSFLPSFCIFPAFKTKIQIEMPASFPEIQNRSLSYVKCTKVKCVKAA